MQRLEGPLALQVWGRFLQLTKEIIGHSRDLRVQNYPALRSASSTIICSSSSSDSSSRCLSVLAEKVTQTTAMDDRRIRKELQVSNLVKNLNGSSTLIVWYQETFGKLLDACVLLVSRSSEQGTWIRRSTKESLGANGRDSPTPRGGKAFSIDPDNRTSYTSKDPKLEEKLNSSTASLLDTPRPAGGTELVSQVAQFNLGHIVP